MFSFGNKINAGPKKRITSTQSCGGQKPSFKNSIINEAVLRILRACRIKPTPRCCVRAYITLVKDNKFDKYIFHVIIWSQCFVSICPILSCFTSTCFFTNTTTSLPFNLPFCIRKLSLINLFIRFRSTAPEMFFFGTASPSRAKLVLLFIAKNKKKLSLDRLREEKTAANSSGRFNLL